MAISAPRSPEEKLIEASGIPYTIIRSTQFLEFLRGIADLSADGNTVRISTGLFQPIAADDVAAIVAEVALTAPRNGIVEIAGPERAPFNEIVARYLKAVGDPREVVKRPEARYFGGRVEDRCLCRWAKRASAASVSTNGSAAHRRQPDPASAGRLPRPPTCRSRGDGDIAPVMPGRAQRLNHCCGAYGGCVAFDVLNVLNGTATGGFSRDASAFVASRVASCQAR